MIVSPAKTEELANFSLTVRTNEEVGFGRKPSEAAQARSSGGLRNAFTADRKGGKFRNFARSCAHFFPGASGRYVLKGYPGSFEENPTLYSSPMHNFANFRNADTGGYFASVSQALTSGRANHRSSQIVPETSREIPQLVSFCQFLEPFPFSSSCVLAFPRAARPPAHQK